MRRRAESSVRAKTYGRGGITSYAADLENPSAPPTPEALLAFAEEFGRMVARQQLANRKSRRGYCLPELMLGMMFNAVMLLLAYFWFAWLWR